MDHVSIVSEGVGHSTQVFNKDGDPIHGISHISIDIGPGGDLVTATMEVMMPKLTLNNVMVVNITERCPYCGHEREQSVTEET